MRHLVIMLTLAAGCGETGFIEGPYTGTTRRFVVDSLELSRSRYDFSDDLDGDGERDNRLGTAAGTLAASQNLSIGVDAMLASGVLSPTLEIVSDDARLHDDAKVGVRFLSGDGARADLMG